MKPSLEDVDETSSLSLSPSTSSPFQLIALQVPSPSSISRDPGTNLWTFTDCVTSPILSLDLGHLSFPVVRCTRIQSQHPSPSSSSSSTEPVEPSLVLEAARKTDLLKGVYEGGFKVWECSLDLLMFLKEIMTTTSSASPFDSDPSSVSLSMRIPDLDPASLIDPLSIRSVLELGCGVGLPALFVALFGRHVSPLTVHFQDYVSLSFLSLVLVIRLRADKRSTIRMLRCCSTKRSQR